MSLAVSVSPLRPVKAFLLVGSTYWNLMDSAFEGHLAEKSQIQKTLKSELGHFVLSGPIMGVGRDPRWTFWSSPTIENDIASF